MSNRWFRFYDTALDDPKVQTLPPELFKAWVNILCLASRNKGVLPPIERVAFALRCDETHAERTIERLLNEGLIDRKNGGPNGYHYAPHNWTKRQYKSDTSTERVKRYRQRKGETAPDTETEEEDKPLLQTRGERAEDEGIEEELPAKPIPAGKSYAFAGDTIRLNQRDFDGWSKAYFAIPDLAAELRVLDDWLRDKPDKQKNWFSAVSGMLARKHTQLLAQEQPVRPSRSPEEEAAVRQRLIDRGLLDPTKGIAA